MKSDEPTTILFVAPKLGYVTFYDGGAKYETGHGHPVNAQLVWDAGHLDASDRKAFMKEVCNGRGGVDDLTRLQDFLVAWGCKLLEKK